MKNIGWFFFIYLFIYRCRSRRHARKHKHIDTCGHTHTHTNLDILLHTLTAICLRLSVGVLRLVCSSFGRCCYTAAAAAAFVSIMAIVVVVAVCVCLASWARLIPEYKKKVSFSCSHLSAPILPADTTFVILSSLFVPMFRMCQFVHCTHYIALHYGAVLMAKRMCTFSFIFSTHYFNFMSDRLFVDSLYCVLCIGTRAYWTRQNAQCTTHNAHTPLMQSPSSMCGVQTQLFSNFIFFLIPPFFPLCVFYLFIYQSFFTWCILVLWAFNMSQKEQLLLLQCTHKQTNERYMHRMRNS